VTVGALLSLGVLVAESSQPDALFINQSGNVGIGTKTPTATLDVTGTLAVSKNSRFNGGVGINTAPIANQNLVITPTKGNVPFNVTDPDGKVSWLSVMSQGEVRMKGGVGINTAPIANQNLVITPTDGNMPFNVTNPAGGVNWLSVMPNGEVRMNAGKNVVIGVPDPNGPEALEKTPRLDVKGEIRGKPWFSNEYEWKKDQPPTRMTRADRSACFLTFLSGKFYGGGEVVEITQSGDYWMLGGKAQAPDVRAKARCIGAPDDSWPVPVKK
jgi:hypothetical protein